MFVGPTQHVATVRVTFLAHPEVAQLLAQMVRWRSDSTAVLVRGLGNLNFHTFIRMAIRKVCDHSLPFALGTWDFLEITYLERQKALWIHTFNLDCIYFDQLVILLIVSFGRIVILIILNVAVLDFLYYFIC